jgi:hypothetical protein
MDPTINNATPIRAAHFTNLHAAIQQLWHTKFMGLLPGWTMRSGVHPTPGSPIFAEDTNDLRRWVNYFESYTTGPVDPPASNHRCGVNSETFIPAGAPVHDDWLQDIVNLGARYVRLKIDPFYAPTVDEMEAHFKPVIVRYREHELLPVVNFVQDHVEATTARDPLTLHPPDGPALNPYIEQFAERVAGIAQRFGDLVPYYELWNEPNNDDPYTLNDTHLPPENFGSRMYYASRTIRFGDAVRDIPAGNPYAVIIAGGIFNNNQVGGGSGWDSVYLEALYRTPGVTAWAYDTPFP